MLTPLPRHPCYYDDHLQDKPNNSIIAFKDNSRAIRGFPIKTLVPEAPGKPSRMVEYSQVYHPTLTAETHNFPTGVAPFPGAETGTGGRLRDVQGKGDGLFQPI